MSSELLKDKIESFIADKNKPQVFNHRYFCDLLGMSKPTFSRSINGKRTPTVEEIRKICQILGRPEDVSDILRGYYSKEEIEHLSIDTRQMPYFLGTFQQLMANPRYFDLVILAKNRKLFRSQYVADYGFDGEKRIQELLEKEVLRLEGDQLFLETQGQQLDIPVVKECIKNTVNFHKPSNMGKMRNQVFFMTAGIDQVKRTRIYEILNTTRLIVTDIFLKGHIGEELRQKMISLMDFDYGDNKGPTEVVALGLVFDDLNVKGLSEQDNKGLLQ